MDKEDIKIGMLVDYHNIIGESATLKNTKIHSEPWQLGHGDWFVAIEGIAGGVSVEALSHSEE